MRESRMKRQRALKEKGGFNYAETHEKTVALVLTGAMAMSMMV